MFELLIYMFENYLSSKSYLDFNNISMELEAAGFDNDDIEEAFDWFSQLKSMSDKIPKAINANENTNLRIFTEKEYKKISSEGLGFILFLEQAKVLNSVEREIIVDRAMALNQNIISIDISKKYHSLVFQIINNLLIVCLNDTAQYELNIFIF